MIQKLDAKSRGIKNLYHVGRELDIPVADLRNAELEYERPTGSPTKVLIEMLHTKDNLSLRKFVTVLQEVGRNDIAHGICNFYMHDRFSNAATQLIRESDV